MPDAPLVKTPFETLDPVIQKWLQSDGVFDTIVALNKELGCQEDELSVIPELIVAMALGRIKPEQTTLKLIEGLPFLEDKQLEHAATVLKKNIFYPIAPTFKKYGVDYEKISTTMPAAEKPAASAAPAAREVKFESAAQVPARPQVAQPAKPSGWQQTPVEPARARTMEFTPMHDIKKPAEIKIPINKPMAPQAKPVAPEVSAAPKPFGLSEMEPSPPSSAKAPEAKHELTRYQDEHPMKEE